MFDSARKESDFPEITNIANGRFQNIAIVDDFHRLSSELQSKISDLMKVLADEQDESRKIIIIGINKVGNSLVTFSPDLNNRISTIRFESNPDDKIEELITFDPNGDFSSQIDGIVSVLQDRIAHFRTEHQNCE